MNCKCGGRSYEEHLRKCAAGYPGHTYRGFVWSSPKGAGCRS